MAKKIVELVLYTPGSALVLGQENFRASLWRVGRQGCFEIDYETTQQGTTFKIYKKGIGGIPEIIATVTGSHVSEVIFG